MQGLIDKAFDKENFQQIKDAVANAERGTSGQVVPCVVDQSSDYEEASVKAFFYTVVVVAFALGLYQWKHDLWLPQFKMSISLLVMTVLLFAGIVSYVAIHWFAPLKRILLGKKRMSFATNRQAKIAFLDYEVFQTKNRTGILIFLSLFERQVHVMADKGLHDKVSASQWNEVVSKIIHGIKQGSPSQGMIDGIKKCGEILREHSASTDNRENELQDDLHIGKFNA